MKWPLVEIGDLAEVVTKGTTPTTMGRPFVDKGINFIKAEALNGDSSLELSGFSFIDQDTHDYLKRSILKEEDVLITIAGANIGKCGYVRTRHLPANTNQAVGIVRTKKDCAFSQYIYYFFKLSSTYNYIQSLSGQAAQPNLNLSNLKLIKVPLPPLPIQKKIASILSSYDDLIENNLRRIELLEQSARHLYEEWFVRFRFPGYEHVKMVNGVPEGWEKKKIGDICQTIGGGTPSTLKPEYWIDGSLWWVTPTDITRNNCIVLTKTEKKITELGLKKSSSKLLPPETILMTSRATIGFFGMIDREICTNQGFISIIPDIENYRMYMLFNLLNRKEEIINNASGSTYKEINKTTFRDMDIIIPVALLLNSFSDFAYALIKQMRNLKKQNDQLKQARDLLLPKLMSGEIAV